MKGYTHTVILFEALTDACLLFMVNSPYVCLREGFIPFSVACFFVAPKVHTPGHSGT